MRQLFLEYQAEPNLQQLVGEIPWGQNLLIMAKVKEVTARAYYLRMPGAILVIDGSDEVVCAHLQ